MLKNLVYDEVLRDGHDGKTRFLDVGCCSKPPFADFPLIQLASKFPVGTDVRKLVADGYPANNVFACELRRSFIDLGYELFNDLDSSNIHFFDADIFTLPVKIEGPTDSYCGTIYSASRTQTWPSLLNKMDHIYAGALFHLFDESTQFALARRLAILSTRSRGAIVFGRHQGRDVEGLLDDHLGRFAPRYLSLSTKSMWLASLLHNVLVQSSVRSLARLLETNVERNSWRIRGDKHRSHRRF